MSEESSQNPENVPGIGEGSQNPLADVPVIGEYRVPRQIVIETDGNTIRIVKAEVAGNIELSAIFSTLANQFTTG